MDLTTFQSMMLGAAELKREVAFTRLNESYKEPTIGDETTFLLKTLAELAKAEENYWRKLLGMPQPGLTT